MYTSDKPDFSPAPKLRASYLKDIYDIVEWPEELSETSDVNITDKYILASLIQINLQLTRLFDVMRIATGLVESTDTTGENADISENQVIDKTSEDKVKEALNKSVMCGKCCKGIVPNRMGYCPKCGNDLKLQIAQELLNG